MNLNEIRSRLSLLRTGEIDSFTLPATPQNRQRIYNVAFREAIKVKVRIDEDSNLWTVTTNEKKQVALNVTNIISFEYDADLIYSAAVFISRNVLQTVTFIGCFKEQFLSLNLNSEILSPIDLIFSEDGLVMKKKKLEEEHDET